MWKKEKTKWIVTYMTDYPYSDTMVVEGNTEKEAWEDFEKKTRLSKKRILFNKKSIIMAGIVKYLNIGRLQIRFVFRHRWEIFEDETAKIMNDITMWREWELGFFFRRFQIVGKKNFHKPKEWKNNLVYEYMFGINLLICKFWFTFVRGGMHINIDEK